MCGITGWAGDPPKDPAVIEKMTALLDHRGPDDRGIFTSPSAHLGHTRLSILDLSDAGHQPMVLDDLVLTYNGEIYNFRELREQIEAPFHSDSDTEVLLHLYRIHGDECVKYLRGMFAFAIWDTRRHRLFVARDRLGIKPIFYRKTTDGIAFASELKSLLELGRPPLEDGAISDYLTYRYIPTPNTVFSGIHKLPPAHTLVWEGGRTTITPYWTPSVLPQITDAGQAIEELDELLGRVIPEHSIADVPVGVFLSGGIDSAMTASYLDKPLTITLGSEVPHRNEAPAARQVAQHLGTRHFEDFTGAPSLDTALDAMPRLFDEPLADSGAWATSTVSKIARRHVTVALTGEGGDELFLGYKRHGLQATQRLTALNRILARLVPPLTDTGRSLERRGLTGFERYAALSSSFTRRQKRAILSPRLSGEGKDDLWYFRQHWREDLEPLQQARWLDLHTYLPDALLTKVDRAGMAHSLEIRPPLLDHRLVEFALSLHPGLLRSADGATGKLILRTLMKDRLPAGHLDRPKIGFNLPIRRWVRSRPEIFRNALDRLAQADIIRRPKINHLGGEQIWSLLVLDRFLHG
ncbi:MAG: asparagine synthase (glutamine-hydrolyzing) [Acidobacteria bacterium]|nr:MAG: asparagine synthase (glutamine-hydrolyzing) [Acidobacteriota bacterium]RLE33894.1 MAG: asparagine synthase (glutamine-hydrolyzing) [Acidobacteriota bacterium]